MVESSQVHVCTQWAAWGSLDPRRHFAFPVSNSVLAWGACACHCCANQHLPNQQERLPCTFQSPSSRACVFLSVECTGDFSHLARDRLPDTVTCKNAACHCCVSLVHAVLCCACYCCVSLLLAVSCRSALCCAMLCCAVLCCAVLCFAVLCCAAHTPGAQSKC